MTRIIIIKSARSAVF